MAALVAVALQITAVLLFILRVQGETLDVRFLSFSRPLIFLQQNQHDNRFYLEMRGILTLFESIVSCALGR